MLRCELDLALAMQWRRGLGLVTEASRAAFSLSIHNEFRTNAAACIQGWWRCRSQECVTTVGGDFVQDINAKSETSITKDLLPAVLCFPTLVKGRQLPASLNDVHGTEPSENFDVVMPSRFIVKACLGPPP